MNELLACDTSSLEEDWDGSLCIWGQSAGSGGCIGARRVFVSVGIRLEFFFGESVGVAYAVLETADVR